MDVHGNPGLKLTSPATELRQQLDVLVADGQVTSKDLRELLQLAATSPAGVTVFSPNIDVDEFITLGEALTLYREGGGSSTPVYGLPRPSSPDTERIYDFSQQTGGRPSGFVLYEIDGRLYSKTYADDGGYALSRLD
jgi:hypothetical protein